MGVRKIRAQGWSLTGFVPSDKNSQACEFESALERDYATILEFDFQVIKYIEQPLRFQFCGADGRPHFGVPDFLVHYQQEVSERHWLVDVKWRSNLFKQWPKLKTRLRAGRRYANEVGYRYKIMTEVEIRTPYLRNARFLLPFRQQHNVDQKGCSRILELLDITNNRTPRSLLKAHSRSQRAQLELLPDIWHLLATGILAADLRHSIHMDSLIWKAAQS